MFGSFLSWSLIVCALGAVPVASRHDPRTANPQPASQDRAGAPGPSQVLDAGDLWHLARRHDWKDKADTKPGGRYILVVPSIGSKPSTGLSGGLSTYMAFVRGDAATTHISTVALGLQVTQGSQVMLGSRFAVFTRDNTWFVLGDNRLSSTTQIAYAPGADAPPSSGTVVNLNVLKLYGAAYRKVAPGLFIGGGVNLSSHFDVRPETTSSAVWKGSAYVGYSEAHGFSTAGQDSSGTSIGFRYDTRDNAAYPGGGSLASATYRTFFNGFLGGDSTWQELAIDARTYKRLTPSGRHKLAFWFLGDLVTGGTAPFWDLPSIAADGRSARGYSEGRYRGEQLLYWETEYRAALTDNGLLGVVVFANATTIGSRETRERLFDSFAPGAGVGLRVLLNKRSRTNLCADYAWGKQGSHGFYLAIQEAF